MQLSAIARNSVLAKSKLRGALNMQYNALIEYNSMCLHKSDIANYRINPNEHPSSN